MRRLLSIIAICTIVLCVAAYGSEIEPADESVYSFEEVYLVLVNKTHELPQEWEGMVDIITVQNSLGEENRIERETYQAFQLLREELLEQDIQIELDSVYRTVEEQQAIWDDWMNDPELGEDYCKKYLAVPGYSEHHTGLAVDIFLIKDGAEIRENDDMITDTADFAKIHALLPKYGFILRYLKGKESITGYNYEPWHLRFLGDPEIATEITEKGITLEEYLGEN